MRSEFACKPGPTAEELRYETEAAFRRVDKRLTINRRAIGSTETRIAHGFPGIPRWSVFNQEGSADVWQTKPPDRDFLYLIATTDVVVSLELF